MLLQFGIEDIAHNLGLLIRSEFGDRKLLSFNDFRKCFVAILDQLQPRSIERSVGGVNFVSDVKIASFFRCYFSNDSMLDDKSQAEVISIGRDIFSESKINLIKIGVDKINILGTGHYELIQSIITDIFYSAF